MHDISLGSLFSDGHVSLGRSRHLHHSHHTEDCGNHARNVSQAEDSASTASPAVTGTAKQAIVNQISATLKQSFNLKQTSVAVAGATPEEQASSDLAGVVSSALHSLNGTPPTEAVATVGDAANGAIQQTAQALQPAGSGAASDLETAVTQIRDQLQSLFSTFLSNADSTQGGTSATATGAKLISNTRGMLEIHTQEGDTITLNFASKSAVSVQDLQAGDGTTQLSGTDIQAFSKSRVTISVQGDLNADELKAVQDLVGQVNQLADGFFSGDINAALSQAGGLSFDGSQLADYSLNLALKQTFEAYGLSLSLPPPAAESQTPATDGSNAAGIASDTPSTDPTAPVAEASPAATPTGDAPATTDAPVATSDTLATAA